MRAVQHLADFLAREPARVFQLVAVDHDVGALRAGEAAYHQR